MTGPSDWLESVRGAFEAHAGSLLWVGVGSIALLVGSLALVPLVIARLPQDYFAHPQRESNWLQRLQPPLRTLLKALKNIAGFALIVSGLLMLVLPGQGVLAILIGISLLDFPGKYRLECWLLGRRAVFRSLNWLRRRLGKPEFLPPEKAAATT